jgi:hypothetical protein
MSRQHHPLSLRASGDADGQLPTSGKCRKWCILSIVASRSRPDRSRFL